MNDHEFLTFVLPPPESPGITGLTHYTRLPNLFNVVENRKEYPKILVRQYILIEGMV